MLIENNPVYEKYPPSRRHSTNNQSIKIIKFNITVNTDSKKRLKYFCNVAGWWTKNIEHNAPANKRT